MTTFEFITIIAIILLSFCVIITNSIIIVFLIRLEKLYIDKHWYILIIFWGTTLLIELGIFYYYLHLLLNL